MRMSVLLTTPTDRPASWMTGAALIPRPARKVATSDTVSLWRIDIGFDVMRSVLLLAQRAIGLACLGGFMTLLLHRCSVRAPWRNMAAAGRCRLRPSPGGGRPASRPALEAICSEIEFVG